MKRKTDDNELVFLCLTKECANRNLYVGCRPDGCTDYFTGMCGHCKAKYSVHVYTEGK